MRWKGLRRSTNVTDERGAAPRIGGVPLSLGRGASPLATIVIVVIVLLVGGPEALNLLIGDGSVPSGPQPSQPLTADDEQSQFVAAILGSTEDVWTELLAGSGVRYVPPELTLFTDAVQSACGFASSAVGPFYCPRDQRVYLDTAFFADLAQLGGPGDFAQAYVIGHEIGHHVQTLLGTSDRVRAAQSQGSQTTANRLQVEVELQADCYAGVWAHHANERQQVLEPGDIEEGLAAAAAIGDDRLQRNAGRRIAPDSFTHGSSAQRQHWLGIGLTSGDLDACDTFR
jgi:uncharacterized protein